MKEEINFNFELTDCESMDRECLVCGKKIKRGSSFHKCSKYSLNKIDNANKKHEEKEKKRTFSDKLKEAEDLLNNNGE